MNVFILKLSGQYIVLTSFRRPIDDALKLTHQSENLLVEAHARVRVIGQNMLGIEGEKQNPPEMI